MGCEVSSLRNICLAVCHCFTPWRSKQTIDTSDAAVTWYGSIMEQQQQQQPEANQLTIETLLSMTPIFNEVDVVKLAARHLFLSHVRSQPSVREVFFSAHHTEDKYENKIDPNWFDFDTFAVLYLSQAVCKLKDDYEIHSLLKETKIELNLDSIYHSPDWKKIGFALYTLLFEHLVKDEMTKVPFRAFMDSDRRIWGRKLSEHVCQKQWIMNNLVHPVVKGVCSEQQYNRDLNILFVKLHLLDPSTVMPTYDTLRKALPDLNLELVTTNYLGDPLDWTLVRHDVDTALHKATYPSNSSRLSLAQLEVYYGIQVMEFIMGESKELGLWNGKYPDNKRYSQFRDRCVVM